MNLHHILDLTLYRGEHVDLWCCTKKSAKISTSFTVNLGSFL